MSSEVSVERPTSLALAEPQVERKVHFRDVDSAQLAARGRRFSNTHSPRKPRVDPDFRPKRKRSASFCAGDYRWGFKRRKRGRVLPSKFLLGGSITDPLNLGSLDQEDCTQTAAVESEVSEPRRSNTVRVIIPQNINDPLNLDALSEDDDALTDALRPRRRRRRWRRKRRISEPGDSTGHSLDLVAGQQGEQPGLQGAPEASSLPPPSLRPLTINTDLTTHQHNPEQRRDGPATPTGTKPPMQRPMFKKQRSKSDNKIVSPVIPQPGGERKRHPSHSRHHADKPHLSQQNLQQPKKFNPKNELFQYGNYNKYYGYRNPDQTPDGRLEYLRRQWFEGREVLDIGCNIGHISLTVARDYNPKRVVGIDIDKKLVNIAQKNIKHYLHKGDAEEANFPKSMRLLYGPLKPPIRADGTRSFPYNIKFIHANYVLESDELLETVRPEFDMILCLSITKWIHLNWGDAGLKRFFRRIFFNLKPGGRLILEPQAWPSYNKRRKLTERIFLNYKNIRLFPEKFNDYLLHEVGFSTSEKIVTPHHTSRGFQRPIIIYTKAGGSSKSSPTGDTGQKDDGTVQAEDREMIAADSIKLIPGGEGAASTTDTGGGSSSTATAPPEEPAAASRQGHAGQVSVPEGPHEAAVPEPQDANLPVSERDKDSTGHTRNNKFVCDSRVTEALGAEAGHSSGDRVNATTNMQRDMPCSSVKQVPVKADECSTASVSPVTQSCVTERLNISPNVAKMQEQKVKSGGEEKQEDRGAEAVQSGRSADQQDQGQAVDTS